MPSGWRSSVGREPTAASAVEGEDQLSGAQWLEWCDEAVHADPHARAFDPLRAGHFLETRLLEPSADVGSEVGTCAPRVQMSVAPGAQS